LIHGVYRKSCAFIVGADLLWQSRGVDEPSDFQGARAVAPTQGRTPPPVRSVSSDQQPATRADLYAAVDALRADMRELMDSVRQLIQEADNRVSDLERAKGQPGQKLPGDL
jgi:hypothetical protein